MKSSKSAIINISLIVSLITDHHREPFDLRCLLLVYNLAQTVFNCWLFYSVFWLWRDHYSWTCQPVDYRFVTLTLRL